MRRHWKKIVIGLGVLVVLVLVGSFVYAKLINKADPVLSQNDVNKLLDATTTAAGATPATDGSSSGNSTPAATGGTVDGNWKISANSQVGYRVNESINGFKTTANGRTQSITGSFVIAGSKATSGDWTVDMTTFHSDESRRDGQFNGRIMDVSQFPTSTFKLTSPIDFGGTPAEGGSVKAKATGDLTLHGTTKSVTFDLTATWKNGRIGVLGNIPVVFADYGIPNPSRATIATDDHGLLEFALVFDRA
jgi:polyisoprenoid-binding protein YceI